MQTSVRNVCVQCCIHKHPGHPPGCEQAEAEIKALPPDLLMADFAAQGVDRRRVVWAERLRELLQKLLQEGLSHARLNSNHHVLFVTPSKSKLWATQYHPQGVTPHSLFLPVTGQANTRSQSAPVSIKIRKMTICCIG